MESTVNTKKRRGHYSPIKVPKEVFDTEKENLIKNLSKDPEFGEKAVLWADDMLAKATRGWYRAPATFEERINRLYQLKLNSSAIKVKRQFERSANYSNTAQLMQDRDYNGKLTDSIFKKLDDKEKEYWLEREKYYFDEFDFNKSSDFSILVGLIADEILMQRLKIRQLVSNTKEDLSKQLSECQSRMINSQKILGITKVQRNLEGSRKEGSVAELSLSLDEKLKTREKEKNKERDLINELKEKKSQRDIEYRGIRAINAIRESDVQRLTESSKLSSENILIDIEELKE